MSELSSARHRTLQALHLTTCQLSIQQKQIIRKLRPPALKQGKCLGRGGPYQGSGTDHQQAKRGCTGESCCTPYFCCSPLYTHTSQTEGLCLYPKYQPEDFPVEVANSAICDMSYATSFELDASGQATLQQDAAAL